MADEGEKQVATSIIPNKMVYILALTFVVIGIVNSTPVIPGWDEMWQKITGIEKLKTRAFATEWFYPFIFFIMMLLVALNHSIWRAWQSSG